MEPPRKRVEYTDIHRLVGDVGFVGKIGSEDTPGSVISGCRTGDLRCGDGLVVLDHDGKFAGLNPFRLVSVVRELALWREEG